MEEVICFGSAGGQTWSNVRGQDCAHENAPCSASSVASESPMISQAEVELLMWVGPLPDRVRKPKLRRQSSKGRPGVRLEIWDYS